ncbi:MAG: hypothetical protein H5T68_01730 [Chloroflexi bacterium]|nr:hypothetical protein [Chloroflexota bacterium]
MAKTLVATTFLAAVPLPPGGLLAHWVFGVVHPADLNPNGVGTLRSVHTHVVVRLL